MDRTIRTTVAACCALALTHCSATGQEAADTLRTTLPLLSDSVRADTTAGLGGVDTLIFYGADTTEGTLDNSTVILKDNAWVRYRGMEIRAARITIEQPLKLMTAEAVPDSVDSTGKVVRWKGVPEFSEAGQTYFGNLMQYNFATRRGKVILGETKMQDGLYYGQTIRKIGENTLYISKGRFTTCENREPHFYFQTDEMKLVYKDKVIAKPVILYIHDVPIFAIPYGIFPNRTGRASGITPPSYNETPREGKQVRNFGYFWAPNDYFDALFQADFLDKAGFLFHGGARYARRYSYTGNISFSYSTLSYITGEKTRLWNIDASHSQTLSESSNLNADIHFVSSKSFYQFTSINEQQILNRQIRTNIGYNSNYEWGSVSASLSQSRNLDNGQREFTFPNVTLTKSSRPLFPKPAASRNQPDRWYQNIQYGYNSNLLRRESQATDTAVVLGALGMNHNASLSAPFKVLSYVNVNPSVSMQETWFDRREERFGFDVQNHDTSVTKKGFFARHTFSTGVAVSTKVYGVTNPGLLGVETFRHVMTPSLSMTYRPDFSSRAWGYYETARDTSGQTRKLDRYRNSILFGGTPSGRTLALGASLSNIFQAKVRTAEKDTAGKDRAPAAKPIDLLNWSSSISYNFEADAFKLSTLATSLSLSNDLARNISLSASLTHDFYRFDRALNRRVEKLNKLPRLTNASVTAGFSLSGGGGQPSKPSTETETSPQNYSSQPFQQPYNQQFLPQYSALPADVPWNARFDFNFDVNKANPSTVTRTFGVNVSGNLRVSRNWNAGYRARYDILERNMVSQSFSFTRDLHCWEMRFEWTPDGPAAGYFFIIQVKSAALRDIKVQRTDYGSRIFN